MNQSEMYTYIERFFRETGCTILEQDPTYIRAQLTVDVDKEITNRPYYWMFVEKTGAEPQPQQLTFVLDDENVPDHVRGELIKFGCWRLHQIFQSAKKNGSFIRLYEVVDQSRRTQGLIPWLFINYRISFISDQKKDIYYPLGFNLFNGEMMTQFDKAIEHYALSPKIPDYHFTLRPIFSLNSAIQRIEDHINDFLESQDTTWAEEANKRLDEERGLITSFFENASEETRATLDTRLEEVEYYRPRIEVNPINVGYIYLQTHPITMFREN
ncbi:YqhG family protein [Caldalkalibacillus salinus]|uniref:YqhG family protein n=1 Tax=Caldalkalibacillus salinus TaxID=2803787 RepID=UPI001922AA9A|nr:YqhG family protein [Caldalkalibacillus salinus]